MHPSIDPSIRDGPGILPCSVPGVRGVRGEGSFHRLPRVQLQRVVPFPLRYPGGAQNPTRYLI